MSSSDHVPDVWIDRGRSEWRVCGRCRGHGVAADINRPWWKFWAEVPCPQCEGTGEPNKFGETPEPPPAPPRARKVSRC